MDKLIEEELEAAVESIFDVAMEAVEHTIPNEVRKKLPDDCFGIISEDENGKKKRSYPLRVPGDKQKTQELCSKAIQMFHYCKAYNKPILAKNIASTIKKEKIQVNISKRNQIFKFVSINDFGPTANIIDTKK